jgi:hypothetical protein
MQILSQLVMYFDAVTVVVEVKKNLLLFIQIGIFYPLKNFFLSDSRWRKSKLYYNALGIATKLSERKPIL